MDAPHHCASGSAASGNSATLLTDPSNPQDESERDAVEPDTVDLNPNRTGGSIRITFMGALRKVKSKIDGNENIADEQREDDLFEKRWLTEFDLLRAEYRTKWETCTHSADVFCGLLFHSSDQQHQAYLLQEYPTIMEIWRDADLTASSMRVRPDWPAARIAYDVVVEYSVITAENCADSDAAITFKPPPSPTKVTAEPTTYQQHIETSPSLHEALLLLRLDFQWTEQNVFSLAARLECEQIFSCAELLACMALRNGAYFERAFQSTEYPRLTKSLCRRLLSRAQELEKQYESVRDLSMEPLRVNPQ